MGYRLSAPMLHLAPDISRMWHHAKVVQTIESDQARPKRLLVYPKLRASLQPGRLLAFRNRIFVSARYLHGKAGWVQKNDARTAKASQHACNRIVDKLSCALSRTQRRANCSTTANQ